MTRSIAFLFFVSAASTVAQPPLPPAPESLAGRWEAPDGRGGFVGMNISVSAYFDTATNGDTKRPNRSELVIGIYTRPKGSADPDEYNFFTDRPGAGAKWDGHRLSVKGFWVNITIDLVWNERSQTWDGVFNRDDYRQSVSLKKPVTTPPEHSFIGTWVNPASEIINNCLHIARQDDGTFTAWSDQVQTRPQNPPRTFERYGSIGKIATEGAGQITVTLGSETGICCPIKFSATVSPDGATLTGDWIPGPNSPRGHVRWLRVAGDSCRTQ